ncbi:MAG: hypothetical protein JST89_26560 [Cyanobacteria bacterium SZAS-4]|nr:hypothetical protein [Cyanobacteria bacterium SZAS-4]
MKTRFLKIERSCVILCLLIPLLFVVADLQGTAKGKASRRSGRSGGGDATVIGQQAIRAYQRRDFIHSYELFNQCVKLDPRDSSFQFYLGMSALQLSKFVEAEHALCRVIVMSSPDSEFATIAKQTFKSWRSQFHGIQPYSQVASSNLMRWDKNKGPIKVWVSNGLQLPEGYRGPQLTNEKCKSLYYMIDEPGFTQRLSVVQHYFPEYQQIVKDGVNDWGWIKEEGMGSIEFVEDPRKADVVFFWCAEWGGGHVGMAFFPWKNYDNSRCIAIIETEYLRQLGQRASKELRKTSAHEFGHILGLNVHSDNPDDVMYGAPGKAMTWMESKQYSNASSISRNDFVTLRALYELPPDEMFEPHSFTPQPKKTQKKH